MALLFPASARGRRRYGACLDALREAVARALSALEWTAYGNWSGREFVAELTFPDMNTAVATLSAATGGEAHCS